MPGYNCGNGGFRLGWKTCTRCKLTAPDVKGEPPVCPDEVRCRAVGARVSLGGPYRGPAEPWQPSEPAPGPNWKGEKPPPGSWRDFFEGEP